MAEQKKGGVGAGAFASSVSTQQRYIVFNLESAEYDENNKLKGAERYLPATASHELFHVLGLDHPRGQTNDGEKPNTRSWEQLRTDIASNLHSANALGTRDPKTGKRTITYSFAADPKLVPHGQEAFNRHFLSDPNNLSVEGMTNLADTTNADRNILHKRIRSAMQEAFAVHQDLLNIEYVEAKDPSRANVLIYAGVIPRKPAPSFDMTRGRDNPYTHDVTIMSYNQAQPGIWAMAAVGDVHALQTVYGKPADDDKLWVVTPQRLAKQAGVLWDHDPMIVRLGESPTMNGSLTIDLSAHPYKPVIEGVLSDEEGRRKVRHHIGRSASIGQIDARDSSIALTATGADDVVIKTGNGANLTLNGRNNQLILGHGADLITAGNGYGHVVTSLGEGDTISARDASMASIEQWNNTTNATGSLVTFWGSDHKSRGSVFVRDATPGKVMEHLKGLALVELAPAAALAVDAVDKDKALEGAKSVIIFNDPKDVMVTADKAAGHGLSNHGAGKVIVKMTRVQYDSRAITPIENNRFYALSFYDNGEKNKMHLELDAKIAITGADGNIERVLTVKEAQSEAAFELILKKGTKPSELELAGPGSLPQAVLPLQKQQR
jgi:hypothetical protein